MKALTVFQPWATLIMLGLKSIETRSWRPPEDVIGGRILIHSAKEFPAWARCLVYDRPFCDALAFAGQADLTQWPLDPQGLVRPCHLPLGEILGSVELVRCDHAPLVVQGLGSWEQAFGDYSRGRYAWRLRDPQRLECRLARRGYQRLWDTDISYVESWERGVKWEGRPL